VETPDRVIGAASNGAKDAGLPGYADGAAEWNGWNVPCSLEVAEKIG